MSDLHPAPHGDRLSTWLAFFILCAGPIAWLVQLCGSAALLGWPCFPMMDRYALPLPNYGWTRGGAIALLVLCLGVAIAAGLVSLIKLAEVRHEKEGDHADLIEIGHGRTRFLALWGVVLSFGFAVAMLLTIVPFLAVPRCAG